jgi:hypothetical protein
MQLNLPTASRVSGALKCSISDQGNQNSQLTPTGRHSARQSLTRIDYFLDIVGAQEHLHSAHAGCGGSDARGNQQDRLTKQCADGFRQAHCLADVIFNLVLHVEMVCMSRRLLKSGNIQMSLLAQQTKGIQGMALKCAAQETHQTLNGHLYVFIVQQLSRQSAIPFAVSHCTGVVQCLTVFPLWAAAHGTVICNHDYCY